MENTRPIKRARVNEPVEQKTGVFFNDALQREYDKRRIDLINYQTMIMNARRQRKEAIKGMVESELAGL